jgi:hypothetical protein
VNLTSPTLEDRQRGGNISGRFIEKAFSFFFDIAFVRGSTRSIRTLETYAESLQS